MSDITHPQLVLALVKKPADIAPTLNDDKIDLIHATMGIVGEAGELLDGIKKYVIYDKELDRDNVVEELGDMEFYMEQLRQRLCITRKETLDANIAKLKKRYEGLTYSDAAAHNRADKVVERKFFKGEDAPLEDVPCKHPRTADMNDMVDAEVAATDLGRGQQP